MSTKFIKLVQDAVHKDYIVVFSKTYCTYCNKVKKIFDEVNDKYTTIELDMRNDGIDLQNALEKMTGARTVPRVFINGAFVGGSSVIEKLYSEGKLENMCSNKCNKVDNKFLSRCRAALHHKELFQCRFSDLNDDGKELMHVS